MPHNPHHTLMVSNLLRPKSSFSRAKKPLIQQSRIVNSNISQVTPNQATPLEVISFGNSWRLKLWWIPSLKLTSTLKMDGWNTTLRLGRSMSLFSGAMSCLFQAGYFEEDEDWCYSTSNQGMDFSWIVCSNSSSLEWNQLDLFETLKSACWFGV